jgi:diaminopimelate decarboxylase
VNTHVPPGFATIDGELAVGGRRVSDWAAEAGDTPLVLYDRTMVAARVTRLRAAMPADLDIHYAIKANPYPPLVHWLAGQVDGLDVASAGELGLALETGLPPSSISFAGPGKREREIEAAVAAGVTLNLESALELERAVAIGARLGKRPQLAVRVNPEFDLKGSGMQMGGGARPFGVDEAEVPALLHRLGQAPADFRGFHIFAGSQNLSADAIALAQSRTVALAARLAAHAPCPPPVVNIGGGFGLPYFARDTPLDVEAVGEALSVTLAERDPVLADTRFVLELGRWLVGEAGVYLTRVVDRKTSHGQTFLVTDGGLHHQLAASGNFGTVIRRNYPVANASRLGAPAEEVATVVGCLCTPLDRLADRATLARTQVGDLIAVFMAGAYGVSASPSAFLGHPAARERLV